MPTDLDQSQETMMVPSQENHRAFRNALGQFGTGVTVITAHDNHSPIGMTVNSFASVSLDPALVLWSIANKSERRDAFYNAGFFAVHVLAEDQADLALNFAKNPTAFEDCEWHFGKLLWWLVQFCWLLLELDCSSALFRQQRRSMSKP